MDKVCVIGGSGFLGSHVVEFLKSSGYEVIIYDLKDMPGVISYKHYKKSILDNASLLQATKGCKYVYNFAGISDLNQSLKMPEKTVELNILGNLNVLNACKVNKVDRFIYASSVYVYSREGGFYRCSKEACESYIQEYYKTYNLNYTILRYGSLYGPRSNSENGLYRIVKNAIQNKKIVYQGDKEAMREYIHIYDAAKSSIEILSEKYVNQNITLTGQQSMKVFDVLNMLKEILNFNMPIEFKKNKNVGHYIFTPYSDKENISYKHVPSSYIDFGLGLSELVKQIKNEAFIDEKS